MKSSTDYKVGDIVTIRSWEDMAWEFGLNEWGDIDCQFGFLRDMECYCGKQLTIASLEEEDKEYILELQGEEIHWGFSTDMFEPKSDKPLKEIPHLTIGSQIVVDGKLGVLEKTDVICEITYVKFYE